MLEIIGKVKNKYGLMTAPAKASLWYTLCNVMLKGLALLSTPIFTRILTKEQYGQYALFQSWYSIISIFATLNLFQSVYSKGLLTYEKKEKEFTSTLIGLSATLTITLGIVCFVFIDFVEKILGLPRALIGLMFIELIAMSAVEFWAAKEKFDYKYKKYAIVTILTSFLSIVLGVIAVVLSDTTKVEARVFADVFAKAIFGIPIFVYLIIRGRKVFSAKYWKYALVFNLPLIPHFLSTFVLNQADRIMIGKMTGEADAAVYSVAYTIATMIMLVVTSLNSALIPFVYKSIKGEKYEEIYKSTKAHFIIIALLSIMTMLFAPEVIALFAGSEYYVAVWIVPPCAVSTFFVFTYSAFSMVEYYYQKTGFLAVASVISAVVNIILNYFFIEFYGYIAAGYTTLVSYALLAVLHYICYRKIIAKNINDKVRLYDEGLISKLIFAEIVIMLAMLVLYKEIWVRYSFILVGIIVIYIKRKFIIKFVKGVKR